MEIVKKENQKVALIFGITGQDGSYLAELLLEKGYMVHGVIRRSSSFNTGRIDHLMDNKNFKLHYGDVTDPLVVSNLITNLHPEEIYNLAAQSHVKVSFEMPYYTAQTDALGTLAIIEAVKNHCPTAKVYQASTSELFGGMDYNMPETGYTEKSQMHPRSPYGAAKIYAYWITKNYREAHNLFISNGLLFNHETVGERMPVIIKKNNIVNIMAISEVVKNELTIDKKFDDSKIQYQEIQPTEEVYIWDKKGWTKILYASGYPHLAEKDNKNPKLISSKNACYFATGSHECIMEDNTDKKFEDIEIGDKVSLVESFEKFDNLNFNISNEEAELIGFSIADGNYHKNNLRLTQKDIKVLEYYEEIFFKLYDEKAKREVSISGFTKKRNINQFTFKAKKFIDKFKIYNSYKEKVVPYQILNSSKEIKEAFLKGYYKGDGLKKDKTIYEYKSFKTNSSTLAMGLIYLFKEVYDLEYNINPFFHNGKIQYQVNLLSNSKYSISNSLEKTKIVQEYMKTNMSQREMSRVTGFSRNFISNIQKNILPNGIHHLSIKNNEVKKILDWKDYDGWFFDLTTETGTFHAGVGHGHIHNSPRRGETFITRKVTTNLAEVYHGKREVLTIGNLDSKRDWGHAQNFVEGMWRMLQHDTADDFVLATNEMHSVREFIEEAVTYLGWEIEWKGEGVNEKGYDVKTGKLLVQVDEKYFRPSEVDNLLGDYSKAKEVLGWEPKIKFKELVKIMMEFDIDNYCS
jgi:GDP-D-mannose dehydratase